MAVTLSEALLARISDSVADRMGLRFQKERWRDLAQGLTIAAGELGFKDVNSCIHWFLSEPPSQKQVEILARHLTVGETYFFREKKAFEVIKERVLPELVRSRQKPGRRLRIWSAGCCTGEEAYSIAMLLDQSVPDLEDWNVTILATDINPLFLQKASEGIYSEWSFRDTPLWLKERYFKRKKEARYEITSLIKEKVAFSYLNLAEEVYPSLLNNTHSMDVIFCRNVLMYFDAEKAKRVLSNFNRALVDGGWLIVSPSEASNGSFSDFEAVNFSGLFFYRKTSSSFRMKVSEFLPLTPSQEPSEISPEENIPPLTPYQEALTLYHQGRYRDAKEKIEEWQLEHPHDANSLLLLARVHANQGMLDEALQWCEKAIAVDKLRPDHHYLHATILQELGRIEPAIRSFRRVIYLDPDFVLAHFALGNLVQKQGNFKESVKYYQNALSLLRAFHLNEELPESEGITVGRLLEILKSAVCQDSSK